MINIHINICIHKDRSKSWNLYSFSAIIGKLKFIHVRNRLKKILNLFIFAKKSFYTFGQRDGGTEVPTHSLRDKGTKGQQDKGTKEQRDKGTKGQRDKGNKGQRDKGTKFQRDTQPLRKKKSPKVRKSQ